MAADTFQLKRGTTAQVAAYTPAIGEPVYDTTLKSLVIGDGVTAGGIVPGLNNANLIALASLTGGPDVGFYFTGSGAMSTYTLSSLGRTLGGIANASLGRSALSAAQSGANTDITSITGSAASLTTTRSISVTGDATWTVNFNGTANATAALTLANTGVGAGTYGSVTVNAKGLVTAGTGIGTGVATFLATPSSANLLAAMTDETGTGSLVFSTSPTLVTPNLGEASATSLKRAVSTQTGNFTIGVNDNWIVCNGVGSITVTLPSPASFIGREIMIKTIAAQTVVSASANVAPLVGGSPSTAILPASAGKYATLVSNGSNWLIMQAN